MAMIRIATIDDASRLAALGAATARAWFADIYSEEEMRAFLARDFRVEVLQEQLSRPEQHLFLLHELEEKSLGFARINWDRPVPGTQYTGAELQKIYYLRGYTGKGLGSRLMRAVIAAVKNRGEPRLWLDVLKSNPDAMALYERLGFRRLGERPFATTRGEIGLQVMLMDLGAGPGGPG